MNGAVVYRGPSMLDGSPIVAIATGLERPTANDKTGDMVQTWILRADVPPVVAVKTGADEAICGDCPLRRSGCYVNVAFAPQVVWKAWRAGSYLDVSDISPRRVSRMIEGRKVRLGAYGDPAAVPARVWRDLLSKAAGHTGYSHQLEAMPAPRRRAFGALVMQSVESIEQAKRAHSEGRRTFRVGPLESRLPNERLCPASQEYFERHGKKTTCERCGLCNGARPGDRRPSVLIPPHGRGAATVAALVAASA